MFDGERGQVGLSFFLFLVLVSMVLGGIYMIDELGLMDVRGRVYEYLEPVPILGEYVDPSSISRKAYQVQQLRELEESLQERRSELEEERQQIRDQERQLAQKRQRIDRQQEQILERERALAERRSRFDDEESRVEYLANLYTNMPPEAAAQRLQNIDEDRVVISILRKMPNRNSAIIMTNMDDQRASVLTRKMAQYP